MMTDRISAKHVSLPQISGFELSNLFMTAVADREAAIQLVTRQKEAARVAEQEREQEREQLAAEQKRLLGVIDENREATTAHFKKMEEARSREAALREEAVKEAQRAATEAVQQAERAATEHARQIEAATSREAALKEDVVREAQRLYNEKVAEERAAVERAAAAERAAEAERQEAARAAAQLAAEAEEERLAAKRALGLGDDDLSDDWQAWRSGPPIHITADMIVPAYVPPPGRPPTRSINNLSIFQEFDSANTDECLLPPLPALKGNKFAGRNVDCATSVPPTPRHGLPSSPPATSRGLYTENPRTDFMSLSPRRQSHFSRPTTQRRPTSASSQASGQPWNLTGASLKEEEAFSPASRAAEREAWKDAPGAVPKIGLLSPFRFDNLRTPRSMDQQLTHRATARSSVYQPSPNSNARLGFQKSADDVSRQLVATLELAVGDNMTARQYLGAAVMPALSRSLKIVNESRPSNPLMSLIEHLSSNAGGSSHHFK